MKLSILILTHKRPELFDRCLKSALNNIPVDVEIIVNNDSRDITEIKHNQITYHYNNAENLSDIYEFLVKSAKGEYVYYLEDDDYLVNDFYDIIYQYLDNCDIIGGNYYPNWNSTWIIKCTTSMSDKFELDDDVFQLGQFIMKRDLACSWEFPNDSHIHNDRKLVQHVIDQSKIKINIPRILSPND